MRIEAKFFNDLAVEVNTTENKKWWFLDDGTPIDISNERLSLLILSEIIEAFEAFRKNLKDDKLPHRDGIEVELADAIIRLLDRMEGKDMEKFKHDYSHYKNNNFDFEKSLHHICKLLTHPERGGNTELLVHSILDICYDMGYDVLSAIKEKREYNKTRLDNTKAHRDSINGKKF